MPAPLCPNGGQGNHLVKHIAPRLLCPSPLSLLTSLQVGDVLLLATDGLFDNVFDEEIEEVRGCTISQTVTVLVIRVGRGVYMDSYICRISCIYGAYGACLAAGHMHPMPYC